MATGTTKTATRGRNRTLGVKTWLGAGALTVGVGAALAAGSAVAQADTGGHQASSSASSSSSSKPDAGPTRSTGVASAKRVSAPVAKVANSKPAAAGKTATANVTIPPINQTIDTPFGPISFVANVTAPTPPDSGAVTIDVTAKTPLGGAKFALNGTSTFSATPTPTSTTALTDGTLEVPPAVAFAASAAGAFVGAGISAADSLQAFVSAAQSGNVVGAFVAWASAAPRFTNALLFGTSTLDLLLPTGGTGPAITAHIPVGGFFSAPRSLSVSWDEYSTTQSGVTVTLAAGDIIFAGSKFGGAAPAFLKIFGL